MLNDLIRTGIVLWIVAILGSLFFGVYQIKNYYKRSGTISVAIFGVLIATFLYLALKHDILKYLTMPSSASISTTNSQVAKEGKPFSFNSFIRIALAVLQVAGYILGFLLSLQIWTRSANPSPGHIPEYAVTVWEHEAKERSNRKGCLFAFFGLALCTFYIIGISLHWANWIIYFGASSMAIELAAIFWLK